MIRRILLAALLLVTTTTARMAFAALDVLIVDPGHTETGDAVASALKSIPEATVDKVDVPALRDARAANRSAIIWIGPEPTLLTGDNGKLWSSILADKSAGLM